MTTAVERWLEKMNVSPGRDTIDLYLRLVAEEFAELQAAAKDNNYVAMVDACIDLKWVTDGLLLMMDVDIEHAESEVSFSNFTKFCSREVAQQSATRYTNERFVPARVCEVQDEDTVAINTESYYIVRESDNKVLKPLTFVEPDWSWLTPPDYF